MHVLIAVKGVMARYMPPFMLLTYHFLFALYAIVRHRHPSRELVVIGVTGTKGKTTTTILMHAALTACGEKVGLLSTIEARIGDTVYPNTKHMTMSGRGYVQRMLRQMV